jgi:cell division transport system ATP-binding protein
MIRFEHASKEYPRSGLALDDVSFQVDKGEFVFLTGHSGAGKSTILRLIHMEDAPSTGEVRVFGYLAGHTRKRDIALLRRKIGIVFQDFRLLQNRSAAENVAFALEVTGAKKTVVRTKVGRLLGAVGLAAKSESFPSELSGGEQQRVALARALANDPLVLLADEPTGNLDARATRGVFELFRSINAGGTAVIFATHDVELVRDHPQYRVIEMERGRIVYDSIAAPPAPAVG